MVPYVRAHKRSRTFNIQARLYAFELITQARKEFLLRALHVREYTPHISGAILVNEVGENVGKSLRARQRAFPRYNLGKLDKWLKSLDRNTSEVGSALDRC